MPPIEDMQKYYKLYQAGRSMQNISDEFKITRGLLGKWFHKLKWDIRPKKLDMTGVEFHNFKVLEDITPPNNRQQVWKCLCKCGNIRKLYTSEINRKSQKSCGCLKLKGYKEICGEYWNGLLWKSKNLRVISFYLTIEEGWEIYENQNRKCYFSGLDIRFCSSVEKARRGREPLQTASLDRLDSNKPYNKDNCVWVHKNVNACKSTLTEDEFISLCQKVANNFPNHIIGEISDHYVGSPERRLANQRTI